MRSGELRGGAVVDVAIVGCGPVGAALAVQLGRRGHRVVVLERHLDSYPLPRAVHFDGEVGRILQACGLGDDLPRISEAADRYEWRNATGQVLLCFGGRPVGPSGWPDMNMFWQPELERLLEAAAQQSPGVEVRRGSQVIGLSQDGELVRLTVEPVGDATGATEGASEVVARYVVGADGARSTVRELLGVPVTDLGFFYDWLIVDVLLHQPRAFTPLNVQICDPARPTTMVSGGPGRRRWEFMRLPHETVEELDDEARAWELLAPWAVGRDEATLERHAVYRFQARWAERWRQGRVLLAGDAAHQMPPFAGQGMCAGLRDGRNLAWKLDLVLRRSAPDAVLDAYEDERAAHVRQVIDFSMALGRVICIADPVEAEARDQQLGAGRHHPPEAPPPLPGIESGLVRPDDPAAGALFVQGRVRHGGEARRPDDVVGAWWRLVATDPRAAEALPAELASWFTDLGGEVVTVDLDPSVDVDGTYGEWFASAGVVAVLMRPDFHLFGAAEDVRDLGPLLSDLRSALEAPSPRPRSVPTPLGGPS